jgi:hypothetical protein
MIGNLDVYINSAIMQAVQSRLQRVVQDKVTGAYAPQVRFKWNGPRGRSLVTVTGMGIRPYQMLAWGTEATAILKARVRKGIGSDDAPMKPLKQTLALRKKGNVIMWTGTRDSWYAKRKAKAGLQPFRDLWGFGEDGGHMLDDVRPTRADEHGVTIDITRQKSRDKAKGNERRSPWWGLSPRDTAATILAGTRILEENLDNVAVSFGARITRRAAPGRPIWMDPAAFREAGRTAA